MIQQLLMCRRIQMLVQALERSKLLLTKIAFIGPAIPGSTGSSSVENNFRGRGKETFCDESVVISRLDETVEGMTSDAGGAGGGFEVDCHCGGCSKETATAGTLYLMWVKLKNLEPDWTETACSEGTG
jgi:hypothetical protein